MRTRAEILSHLSYYSTKTPSECGLRVAMLLEEWDGLHHFDESTLKKVEWSNPLFQVLRLSRYHGVGQLSTFDFDLLTRLVFLAHDHNIRIQIGPCNPQFLEVVFHPRHKRDGGISERHPTIEQALGRWRESHPAKEETPEPAAV